MPSYKLNEKADADFDRLYEWGIQTFGLSAARNYALGMITRFKAIAETPLLWPAVDDIKEGYRRSVFRAHSIYYRIEDDSVEIMRILGQEDVKTELERKPR